MAELLVQGRQTKHSAGAAIEKLAGACCHFKVLNSETDVVAL